MLGFSLNYPCFNCRHSVVCRYYEEALATMKYLRKPEILGDGITIPGNAKSEENPFFIKLDCVRKTTKWEVE